MGALFVCLFVCLAVHVRNKNKTKHSGQEAVATAMVLDHHGVLSCFLFVVYFLLVASEGDKIMFLLDLLACHSTPIPSCFLMSLVIIIGSEGVWMKKYVFQDSAVRL